MHSVAFPPPPDLSPVPRIGVVALEIGHSVLVTESDWNTKGFPGVQIHAEQMTKSECAAALAPFAEVSLQSATIRKATEFDHIWNGHPARLIVYLVRRAFLTAESLHLGASFLDLSRPLPDLIEPSVPRFMVAREHLGI